MAGTAAQKVTLPAIVDLDSLDQIRDSLIDAAENGPVRIDAGAVERVATNALIMLLSAGETAARNNSELVVENISESMTSAVERLGLTSRFEPLIEGSKN